MIDNHHILFHHQLESFELELITQFIIELISNMNIESSYITSMANHPKGTVAYHCKSTIISI